MDIKQKYYKYIYKYIHLNKSNYTGGVDGLNINARKYSPTSTPTPTPFAPRTPNILNINALDYKPVTPTPVAPTPVAPTPYRLNIDALDYTPPTFNDVKDYYSNFIYQNNIKYIYIIDGSNFCITQNHIKDCTNYPINDSIIKDLNLNRINNTLRADIFIIYVGKMSESQLERCFNKNIDYILFDKSINNNLTTIKDIDDLCIIELYNFFKSIDGCNPYIISNDRYETIITPSIEYKYNFIWKNDINKSTIQYITHTGEYKLDKNHIITYETACNMLLNNITYITNILEYIYSNITSIDINSLISEFPYIDNIINIDEYDTIDTISKKLQDLKTSYNYKYRK